MNVSACRWLPPPSHTHTPQAPPPTPPSCFPSFLKAWVLLCVSVGGAAISARVSRSSLAAESEGMETAGRGVGALKSCPGEALAAPESPTPHPLTPCSFTLQGGLEGLELPCGVMDTSQRLTHARRLQIETFLCIPDSRCGGHSLWHGAPRLGGVSLGSVAVFIFFLAGLFSPSTSFCFLLPSAVDLASPASNQRNA